MVTEDLGFKIAGPVASKNNRNAQRPGYREKGKALNPRP